MIEEDFQSYIHLSKYSRWIPEVKRRETWDETVDRLASFWFKRFPELDLSSTIEAVRRKDVMPSMRSLMTAGKALERDNAAGYNCAAIAIDSPRCFDEVFYLLMCG